MVSVIAGATLFPTVRKTVGVSYSNTDSKGMTQYVISTDLMNTVGLTIEIAYSIGKTGSIPCQWGKGRGRSI